MANAVVGALRVTLGLDSAAFENGLTDAQKKMQDVGGRLRGIATTMAGVGVAIGAALGGAFAAVNEITGGLVEMGREAETAGVAFEEFQKLKYVAEQAGVSVEALTDGMKEMQLRADEFAATGGGSAAEAFQRIGLTGAQLTESLKNPAAMFDDIIARISKLDTAAQIRVADEIFGGTGGEQFVRLLDMGAEGIAQLKEEFVANGGLIPEEQLKKAEAFRQSMDKVKASLGGLATNALVDSGLLEWFAAAIPKVIAFGRAAAEYLGPKLMPIFDALMGVIRSVAEVVMSIFGDSGEASSGVITFGEIIKRIFEASLTLIQGALEVIADLLSAFGALLRGDFSAMWGHLGDAVAAVVAGIGRAFAALFPEVVNWVRQTYEGVRQWLLERFTALVRSVIEKIQSVGQAFYDLYDKVVGNSYIPDMVIAIGDWIGRLDDVMVNPVQDATAQAADAFSGLSSSVESSLEGIIQSIGSKDWKGALGGIFDIVGEKGSGGWSKWANVGSSLLKALPGFATGGSFKVGGSGTVDSKLVAFRATPGERVDISTPGQQRHQGGGGIAQIVPSPYFDVQVLRTTQPAIAEAERRSNAWAAANIPGLTQNQIAARQRYSTGRVIR